MSTKKDDPAVVQANMLRSQLARAMYEYASQQGATTREERLAILKPIAEEAKAVVDEVDAVFIETMVEELKVDWVQSLQRIFFATVEPVSLDAPAFAGTEQGGGEYVDPIINFMYSNEDGPEALVHKAHFRAYLDTVLDEVLKERDAAIIRRRFGVGCKEQTLAEVARFYRITQERTRQIQDAAVLKLCAAFRRRGLSEEQFL